MARDYLCDHYTPDSELYRSFVSLAMISKAKVCIIPIQDYMGLDNSCRMNQPSTVGKNWRWRLTPGQVTDELAQELCTLAKRYGRMNWAAEHLLAEEKKLAAKKAEKDAEETADKAKKAEVA